MTFMNTPVGANKKYIVYLDGDPFAGFDKMAQAKMYVAMQKAKKKAPRSEPAYAAGRNWEVRIR